LYTASGERLGGVILGADEASWRPSRTGYRSFVLLPLTGPRLRVRAWRDDEAADVMGLLGSDATMGETRAGRVHSADEAARWLQGRLRQQRERGLTMWAVERRADDVLVGACGVFPQQTELELAYIISHKYRGERYAAEAAGLVLAALRVASIEMPVYATIRPGNYALRRVAEGLGLRCAAERTDDRGPLLVYRV